MVQFLILVILKTYSTMANKIKIDNAILKRRKRKEKKRKQSNIPERKYFLIVCEGEKTEPNYFKAIKEDLGKGKIEIVNIKGLGKETIRVVEEAKKLRTEYEENNFRKLNQTWTVFDRDSFPAKNFNEAIIKGENLKRKIKCAWTNEAFELWFLLHFHFYNTGISRKQYQSLIEKLLSEKMKKEYKYKKNSTEIYSLLKKHGNQEQAIKNSIKLCESYGQRKDYANHNPCSKVYELIIELFELDKKNSCQVKKT